MLFKIYLVYDLIFFQIIEILLSVECTNKLKYMFLEGKSLSTLFTTFPQGPVKITSTHIFLMKEKLKFMIEYFKTQYNPIMIYLKYIPVL